MASCKAVPEVAIFSINWVVLNVVPTTSAPPVEVISPGKWVTTGMVPVQNCHPAGGLKISWLAPLGKSALLVSVTVMGTRVVQDGREPLSAVRLHIVVSFAGVMTTCANPE